jgi:hypothetical protein
LTGFIDWITERVEVAIEKHGLTRDLELDRKAKAFMAGRPRAKQYETRSQAELAGDVNRLSDLLQELVRERDQMVSQVQRIPALELWVKILGAVASTELLIIGWFATELFSRLH